MIDVERLAPAVRLGLACGWYVAAYAAGIALFAWLARRRGVFGPEVRTIALAALAGGAVGGSLAQLAIDATAGRTLLGGVAGGWIAVVLAKRALGVTRPLGDFFAVAIAGGEAVGRIGCFFAGCCYGKVAHVAWAVSDHGALRHPTQLYTAAWAAATLAVLVVLERRAGLRDGDLFSVQGALLCLGRFAIEWFRAAGPVAGPLTVAQWACIAGFAFFAAGLARRVRRAGAAA